MQPIAEPDAPEGSFWVNCLLTDRCPFRALGRNVDEAQQLFVAHAQAAHDETFR